jgi:hypothetical protein
LLRRFAPRNDGVLVPKHTSAFPRRVSPGLCKSFRPSRRGRRERRVLAAPAVSCAKLCEETHTSIQVQSEHPGIPCAMVLRLMPRSPRRRIRLVTVVGELAVLRKPGWAFKTSADLTPATGARTTRFCRTQQCRSSVAPAVRSRTEARPATTTTRPTLPRPPHPVPTFVTMANAPLPGRDGGSYAADLGGDGKRNIFVGGTGQGKSR